MAGKRCRIAFLWATFLAFLAVPIFGGPTNVFADDGGWIGGGVDDSGTGSGSPGSGSFKGDGYSWIFYKANDKLSENDINMLPETLYFTPNPNLNGKWTNGRALSLGVDKMCLEHAKDGSGIWAVGMNGNGDKLSNGAIGWGNGANYTPKAMYPNYELYTKSDGDFEWHYGYSTTKDGWGHRYSNKLSVLKSNSGWIGQEGGFSGWRDENGEFHQNKFDNNKLSHELWVIRSSVGGRSKEDPKYLLFSASKYGWSNSNDDGFDNVFEVFKKACAASGSTDCGESRFNNTFVFCYWEGMEEQNVTLDAFTVDSAGNYINTSGGSTNEAGARISGMPKSVKKNEQGGTISAPDIVGYKFIGWRQNRTAGATGGTQSNYNVGIMDVDKTFYAVYEKISVFKGSTNAESGGRSTNMALTDTTKILGFNIDCPSTSGCEVTFKHRLKRESGSDNTDWKIYRLSNYWDGTYGAEITPNVIASGTFGNNNETVVRTQTYKLKPGVKICEQMDFKVDDSKRARTTVCVLAVGSTSETLLDIRVKNDTIGGSYEETAYAKPGDTVTYKTTYDPSPQYTYNLIPGKLQIDGGTVFDNESGTQLFRLFDNNVSSGLGWKNAFNITGFGGLDFNQNNIYSGGDASKKEPTNTREITSADVGKSLIETAKTNVNDSVKTTPKKVAFSAANNGDIIANVITNEVESSATVVVPYNFTISTEIVDAGSSVVYAGENSSIRYKVEVNEKDNQLTKGAYATKVTGVKHRVEFCLDGVCRLSELKDIDDGDLNPGGGKVTKEYSLNIKMPDTNAGSEVCMRSLVTPSSSGSDDNTSPSGFNKDAASSDYACIKIAKKPSFQVWGGNLFVNGNVTVPVSEKGTLSGYGSGLYKFGSWSELGVFGNGQIKGISSGASVGYSGANFLKNPGGLNKTNACLRSVLSFANNRCSSGTTGNMAASGLTTDKSKLSDYIDKIAPGMNTKIGGGNISLGSGYSTTDKGVAYWLSDSDLAIGASTLASGKTYVVRSKNNVTINGNLEYENKSYTNLNEIPKLFIYAEGNIKIACGVNRIDAVLITKGDVNTCSDSSDINNEANSNRLRVNGAIIANTAHLNRTYGAGVGNQSMVPAEIINYDTTLYMWLFGDTSMTGDGSNDAATFTEVRREELAPRY